MAEYWRIATHQWSARRLARFLREELIAWLHTHEEIDSLMLASETVGALSFSIGSLI